MSIPLAHREEQCSGRWKYTPESDQQKNVGIRHFTIPLNGVGFFLTLLVVALVVLYRLKNPEGRLKIGRKKRL